MREGSRKARKTLWVPIIEIHCTKEKIRKKKNLHFQYIVAFAGPQDHCFKSNTCLSLHCSGRPSANCHPLLQFHSVSWICVWVMWYQFLSKTQEMFLQRFNLWPASSLLPSPEKAHELCFSTGRRQMYFLVDGHFFRQELIALWYD